MVASAGAGCVHLTALQLVAGWKVRSPGSHKGRRGPQTSPKKETTSSPKYSSIIFGGTL